jgi:hypothetical protein
MDCAWNKAMRCERVALAARVAAPAWRYLSFAACALALLWTDPARAGCASGNVANTDLLSSANCQADASGNGGTLAVGFNAAATGTDSTALGAAAEAAGDQSTSVGLFAGFNQSGTSVAGVTSLGANTNFGLAPGEFSTAVGAGVDNQGTAAQSKGEYSIAIGGSDGANGTHGALATGASAIAIGVTSTASGISSIAMGNGATAGFDNSAAFGVGATTSRANQQSFGTATNTYTMAGITSVASKTAQGAPTHLVTSNAGGDLAAYTPAELGIATTAELSGFATQGDISNLQSQIDHLGKRDQQLTEGIATVASLAQPILLPGQHFAMRAGWGGYDDASAVGFSAAGVVASNLLSNGRGTLTLDGGVGFGTSEGEVAGRAGASFGW